jgi:hypothetical protein
MKQKIQALLRKYGEVRVSQIMEEIGASRQYIHRVLSEMQLEGLVEKLGTAPLTYYRLKQVGDQSHVVIEIAEEKVAFLKEHFLLISETGERLEGFQAMIRWCSRQKLPLEKTMDEFILTRKKYLHYYDKNGLISGIDKIKNTVGFSTIGLDALYYQDFYAIERFGKTKLGSLLHFAKQGQSRVLIQELADQIKPTLMKLIATSKIEAVGFIPPTIQREVQFMSVLESRLNLQLPQVHLVKVKGEIVVPQKALNKLEDRIQNARSSIMIAEKKHFERILLIDDAVGSGATINETSIKLKARGTAKTIIGYAITGSYKGFDVIQEV